MSMGDIDPLVYVLFVIFGFALALAVLFAQLRLFSIDKSLKQILTELEEANRYTREEIAEREKVGTH
jgi:hypothetical protein